MKNVLNTIGRILFSPTDSDVLCMFLFAMAMFCILVTAIYATLTA